MIAHNLTELIYSNDLTGPFRLYILYADGTHNGGQWFDARASYRPRLSELTSQEAMTRAAGAVSEGLEVRITNSADEPVFHCSRVAGVLHPPDVHGFWAGIGAIAK